MNFNTNRHSHSSLFRTGLLAVILLGFGALGYPKITTIYKEYRANNRLEDDSERAKFLERIGLIGFYNQQTRTLQGVSAKPQLLIKETKDPERSIRVSLNYGGMTVASTNIPYNLYKESLRK